MVLYKVSCFLLLQKCIQSFLERKVAIRAGNFKFSFTLFLIYVPTSNESLRNSTSPSLSLGSCILTKVAKCSLL
jgi:hypothetical protein